MLLAWWKGVTTLALLLQWLTVAHLWLLSAWGSKGCRTRTTWGSPFLQWPVVPGCGVKSAPGPFQIFKGTLGTVGLCRGCSGVR